MAQDDPSQTDLTRVESVHWGQIPSSAGGGPDNVTWEDFAGAIRSGPEITFSRPVRAETVHPASVFLTALLWERQADYLLSRRIPAKIEAIDSSDGYAKRFRLCINPGWIQNEIESRSELKSGGRVELTIRGQMIRDRYDNLLDALPLGYAPQTPPHSRSGGGFLALLRSAAGLGHAPRRQPHSCPGGDFVALLRFAAETRAPPAAPEPEHEASPDEAGPGAEDY